MTHCRAILQPSAGFQQIDHVAAAEHGIPVCNCAGANDVPVAEHSSQENVHRARDRYEQGLAKQRTELI